jgi:undecaprenyl-diphosphatase
MGGTAAMVALASVACVVLAWRRLWEPLLLVVAAVAGAGVCVQVLKAVVGRARPPVADRLVAETSQSFPSGHSLGSATVLGVLAALVVLHSGSPARRAVAVALAAGAVAAIGGSRLYLGVHWPTDVVGGWVIGACWLTTCLTAHARLRRTSGTPVPEPAP